MIVKLTDRQYPSDEYAVGIDRRPSLDEAAGRLKIRQGSYAFELLASIHWGLFSRSTDLKYDYEHYFAIEYESFTEYLARRYRFSADACQDLLGLFHAKPIVLYYKPSISLLGGDDGRVLLQQIINAGALT